MTLRRLLAMREVGNVALLLLIIVIATLREPRFLQPGNIESILLWVPLLAIVGIGQMMVIVTRGIDVSVGSMVGLSAMVGGIIFRDHPDLNVAVGIGVVILTGTLLGAINGFLVAITRIPPIITTLGTLSMFRGLTFMASGGKQINSNEIPDTLTNWSLGGPFVLGGVTVPWILLAAIGIAAAAAWFLNRTRAGRDIFAYGSNPQAARLRGIPTTRTTFLVYVITGALCGFAGILYASRYGFVNPGTAGAGLELLVIASVVIGGTNVAGGSGSVWGVLLGALFLGTVNVSLSVLGIAETWQQLVYGLVILAAILVDTGIRRATRTEAAH